MSGLSDLNGTYSLDPAHSELTFTTRYALINKVRGSFTDYSGTAQINGSDIASSSVEVTVQTASVDTRNSTRDDHVKNEDFFDVAKYPTMTFKSTSVSQNGDNDLDVTGDLTIKDSTQSVTIPLTFTGVATDPFGNERAGFEGELDVNRKDFGLTWNAALETGGVLVADKVTLSFDLSLIKQA